MSLNAISPIDGRYEARTAMLADYFSERALMRYRALVEVEYFIALLGSGIIQNAGPLSSEDVAMLRSIATIDEADGMRVKEIEKTTNHDVKAIEYFLKEKLKGTSLEKLSEWIHFGLTSEDVNNLSYALMLSDGLEHAVVPEIETLVGNMNTLAEQHADMPMLSRTHGQSASPTTFGKEIKVFVARIEKRLTGLKSIHIQAKLNGATGNWNAHVAAFPNADWMSFTKNFVAGLAEKRMYKLEANLITTQIECHDSYVAVFDTLRRINTILIDFDQDMWRYISDGWVVQKPKEGEIGSSAMPHKVNPIDFENAEGNFGMANALFEFFARKLPISRLQRDLSDSTVERNFGVAFAHSLLGYTMTMSGLSKVAPNEVAIREALLAHPEVLAEAIQTVLRREGVETPYEKLKELTRGKAVTMEDLHAFIGSLSVSDSVKAELLKFTPDNYIGLSAKIARM